MPNLRRLSLETPEPTAYQHPKNICSLSDKDMDYIEECHNLEELTLVNQTNISSICLSRLPKLQRIKINRNANLETIEGIDKLPELYSLECCGNKSLEDFKGLDKTIAKGNLEELKLDVLLFPSAVGYKFGGTYNQDAAKAMDNMGDITWQENLGNTSEYTKIGHNAMLNLHNKACEIIENNVPRVAPEIERITAIEEYLARNVTYDHEALTHPSRSHTSEGVTQGDRNGINGTFNCLMLNSCVCEGYTRGEQYLLALCNIKSKNVECIGEKDNLHLSDPDGEYTGAIYIPNGHHSIVKIKTGDRWLYSDPCWNACHYQSGDKSMPYSLLTKSEMSRTHTLSFEERNVFDTAPISRSQIALSIEHNTAFRRTKASEVQRQRKDFNRPIRGVIRKADGHAYN